ncbi:TIGR02444 family protein [Aliivibrio fischeri]|uniref:TIGR02444 family protein n=1 Tax=Aliivibrio fischeri TaxID=668 RepID=UPI00080EE0D6|nr:TIGR02444 family protein [Aliivibrio fischeri]OCH04088.1 TIGR02444 family protein [Aliivibrio fischeri]
MLPSSNIPLNEHQLASITQEAFWCFSLSHYKKGGVKQAALALQDTYFGNVNLALLLIWLNSLNLSFSVSDLPLLEAALHKSDTLLHSYRKLRKQIKSTQNKALYQEALQFELQIEKQQQSDLITALIRIPLVIKTDNNQISLLTHYCRSLQADTLLAALESNQHNNTE